MSTKLGKRSGHEILACENKTGLPTTALLAHIAISKFAWHIPLHRQTKMLASSGITIDRSTLVHWIERAAWWLRPLHALLAETVLSSPKVFCDDTPLPVLDRTRTRTRIGRIWCYAVDDRPWQGSRPRPWCICSPRTAEANT